MNLSPRWRKVYRDLWDNKSRTILVVLAISVGVFSFGSAFITGDVLVADMDAQYQATNTASIIMNVGLFDDGLVRWAQHQPQIADAQGWAQHSVQLVTPTGKVNLELIAVSDDTYRDMRLDRFFSEEGAWPPGRREILIERSSAPLAGAEIGDTLTIELASGRERQLTFAGTTHDLNAVPATIFPLMSGYVTFETLGWLGFPIDYTSLHMVAEGGLSDTEELSVVADEVNESLRRRGVVTNSVSVQDPSRHWGSEVTQGFILVLTGVGIFSLVLSGFLVVNTITGILTQQKRQIGMMKAVGATGPQIFGVYMAMIISFGLLALLVALPVGALLAYAATSAVANFLNVDVLNFHIPARVFALELAASLIAPVAAGVLPIVSGLRVTVREATSDYGLGTRRRRGLIDVLLANVRGLPRPLLLSLRNTFRRKGRLFLTLGTLTLAGALFISVINVRGSMLAELDRILGVYNYDIAIVLDDNYNAGGLERRAERVPGVTRAQALASVNANRIRDGGGKGPTFQMIGVPPTTSLLQPTVIEGRWLTPDDSNAVVVSSEWLNNEPGVRLGDTVVLEVANKEWEGEVVGIYLLPGDTTIYGTFDFVSRVAGTPGLSPFMLVETEIRSGPFEDAVAEAMEESLKGSGIGVGQVITRDLIVGASVQQFDFLIYFLLATAVLVAAVGALGLAGTMSLNVLERTREIGVMRAIGASTWALRGIVVVEGVLIGLFSWAIATPFSAAMSAGFAAALGVAIFQRPIPFTFNPIGVVIWLVIAVVISAIASLLPAGRASRVSVREALAYE